MERPSTVRRHPARAGRTRSQRGKHCLFAKGKGAPSKRAPRSDRTNPRVIGACRTLLRKSARACAAPLFPACRQAPTLVPCDVGTAYATAQGQPAAGHDRQSARPLHPATGEAAQAGCTLPAAGSRRLPDVQGGGLQKCRLPAAPAWSHGRPSLATRPALPLCLAPAGVSEHFPAPQLYCRIIPRGGVHAMDRQQQRAQDA